MFESCPTVARTTCRTLRISPEGMRIWAYSPSLAMTWPKEPAVRMSLAPEPGWSSSPWIWVPSGMPRMGSVLPGRMSTASPDTSTSPTPTPSGARM